jgi:hypothetical protein
MLCGLAVIGSTKLLRRGDKQLESEPIRVPTRIHVPSQPATIYLYEAGAQTGPFSEHHIREMLDKGSLSSEVFYWEDGMPDWRSVNEFSDRF